MRPKAYGDEEEREDDLEQLRLMQRMHAMQLHQQHPQHRGLAQRDEDSGEPRASAQRAYPAHMQRPQPSYAMQQPSPSLFQTPPKLSPTAGPPFTSPLTQPFGASPSSQHAGQTGSEVRDVQRHPSPFAASPLPAPATPSTPSIPSTHSAAASPTPMTPSDATSSPSTPGTPATPSTPGAATAVYVPSPSSLTQAIKPHLRRPLPAFSSLTYYVAVDEQLASLVSTLIPPDSSLASREACRAELERLIQSVWPEAQLQLFGSSVNLLCDLHSDCDLSLIMPPSTRVKQSCYNTFKPRPREPRQKDKNGAEKSKDPTQQQQKQQQQQQERKELQAEVAPPSEGLLPPATPASAASPSVKASPALTADALPTLDLSKATDVALLALSPVAGEEWIEPGVVVEKLATLLKTDARYTSILALPKARVPIVKFEAREYERECDVGINNLLALENSGLIRAYMACDARARQLTYVIKHWAKQRKINDPFRGTLSSYAYVLMTIHFLQQLSPPVLPCLQSYAKAGRPVKLVSGYDCHFFPAVGWTSHSRASLAQLFSGWLFYYAHAFGYTDDVISVRVGGVLAKRSKEKEWASSGKKDRHLLSIEDPFEVSHDVGRVCDATALYEIRGECIRGIRMINEGKAIRDVMAKYEKEWRGS